MRLAPIGHQLLHPRSSRPPKVAPGPKLASHLQHARAVRDLQRSDRDQHYAPAL